MKVQVILPDSALLSNEGPGGIQMSKRKKNIPVSIALALEIDISAIDSEINELQEIYRSSGSCDFFNKRLMSLIGNITLSEGVSTTDTCGVRLVPRKI